MLVSNRMRLLSTAILLVSTLIGVVALAAMKGESCSNISNKEYELVFFDDFNKNSLDSAAWSKISRGKYAWNKYMSPHLSLYQFSKGYMRLIACPNNNIVPNDTAKYLTGGISTEGKKINSIWKS